MIYASLKLVHVVLAFTSITGFVLRWVWKTGNSEISRNRWVNTLPHIIDTLFLLSGLWLAYTISQYPLLNAWLTAKVDSLLPYRMLGGLAMSPRLRPIPRTLAFIAAVSVFSWIVSVALTKSPAGMLPL